MWPPRGHTRPAPAAPDRRRLLLRGAGGALALAALSACAGRPAPIAMPAGRAVVLGPDPGLDLARLPEGWFLAPPRPRTGFAVAEVGGMPVLRIERGDGAVLGRAVAANLLAAPYLRWGWYLAPEAFAGGPGDGAMRGLRIVVGFRGGTPGGAQLLDRLFAIAAAGYPPHDRVIDIVLGGRGAARPELALIEMLAVSERGLRLPLRGPAGGQTGRWLIEAIDLGALYGELFARDRRGEVEIAFIGWGALPAAAPAPAGYIAEMLLTR